MFFYVKLYSPGGIWISEAEVEYNRRFSFLSNDEFSKIPQTRDISSKRCQVLSNAISNLLDSSLLSILVSFEI